MNDEMSNFLSIDLQRFFFSPIQIISLKSLLWQNWILKTNIPTYLAFVFFEPVFQHQKCKADKTRLLSVKLRFFFSNLVTKTFKLNLLLKAGWYSILLLNKVCSVTIIRMAHKSGIILDFILNFSLHIFYCHILLRNGLTHYFFVHWQKVIGL